MNMNLLPEVWGYSLRDEAQNALVRDATCVGGPCHRTQALGGDVNTNPCSFPPLNCPSPQALLTGDHTRDLVYSMASMASMDASNSLTPDTPCLPSTSPAASPLVSPALLRMPREKVVADPEAWRSSGFPPAVTACVLACAKGEEGNQEA